MQFGAGHFQEGALALFFLFCFSIYGKGEGMTNNVAEYHALIRLLTFAKENQLALEEVLGDSQLIINMATCLWGNKKPHKKAPHLLPLCLKARELVKELGVPVFWIPREENTLADAMSTLS